MKTRTARVVLAVWAREMYDYLKNLHVYATRLVVEPLLFIFIFGMGLGRRVVIGDVNYLDFMAPGIIHGRNKQQLSDHIPAAHDRTGVGQDTDHRTHHPCKAI
ncbi:MAG: hypothetical protein U9N12_07035 [Euryarchaeota archaeon]|nr:hypothetical protein [Euryarchaeota archaeon]